MYSLHNFTNNDDVKVLQESGAFSVIEYQRDLSVTPGSAMAAYFSSQMNVRKRQLICDLNGSGVILQSGAMHWIVGDVNSKTNIKGVGDLVGKMFTGKVTGESTVKPLYEGTGKVVLEPTYRHILLVDVGDWDNGMVIDDGLFLACEESVKQKVSARSNLSSAVAGGKGLFNLCLAGEGIAALECYCPKEELIEVRLQNDTLKVDGNFAICWSKNLDFTVERSSKSLVGSAVNGEGLVNVYRGTGRVFLAPLSKMPNI